MTKMMGVVTITVVLLLVTFSYAQRPPELNERGEAYLRVNINPTPVPPMVNINPFDEVPRVEVTRMPEIQLRATPPTGCDDQRNFRTDIGDEIAGPLLVSYLNFPQEVVATLNDENGERKISLGTSGQVTTAIYLQAGQTLGFSAAVLYSGCTPN